MRMIEVVFVAAALLAGCGEEEDVSQSALGPAGGGISACTECCKALFPPGRDRGQCIADAAHHTGVCWCTTQCCVLDMSVPLDLAVPPDLSLPPDLASGGDGAIP